MISECSLSGRGQDHVSNFYIVDLENIAIASRRYTGDIHNSVRVRFVYNTWGRMHDAGVRVSPGLKSTYDGLATTPVCMTPT